jgi:hypothetical protein
MSRGVVSDPGYGAAVATLGLVTLRDDFSLSGGAIHKQRPQPSLMMRAGRIEFFELGLLALSG